MRHPGQEISRQAQSPAEGYQVHLPAAPCSARRTEQALLKCLDSLARLHRLPLRYFKNRIISHLSHPTKRCVNYMPPNSTLLCYETRGCRAQERKRERHSGLVSLCSISQPPSDLGKWEESGKPWDGRSISTAGRSWDIFKRGWSVFFLNQGAFTEHCLLKAARKPTRHRRVHSESWTQKGPQALPACLSHQITSLLQALWWGEN